MTLGQITMAIDNSASDCNRMCFSDGDPIVVLDKLFYGLKYAKALKDKTGFLRNICVQTNGNVLPCIYGFDNVMGNIYDDTIKDILDEYSKTEAYKVLRDGSVCEFISKCQESNAEISITDICEVCNTFFRNLGRR